MLVTVGQLFKEPRATLERLCEEANLRKSFTALVVSLIASYIVGTIFFYFFGYMTNLIRMPLNAKIISYADTGIFAKFSAVVFVEAILFAIIIAYVYYGIAYLFAGDTDRHKFLATDYWAMAAVNWVFVIGMGLLLGMALIGFYVYHGFLLVGAWASLMIFFLFLSISFFYYYLVAKVATKMPDTHIVFSMLFTMAIFIILGAGFGWILLKLLALT